MLEKLRSSFRQVGFVRTFLKTLRYPIIRIVNYQKIRLWQKILRGNLTVEERFSAIYLNRMWGDGESVSGSGSSLERTEKLRAELPRLIQKYDVKIIFDAPCGDLNWMKHLLPKLNVRYIGADIVKDLIERHTRSYGHSGASFLHLNLIEDSFPKADLMICRDCLFHLSVKDIKQVLQNFLNADIPYLLTTTHTTRLPNLDISTGDFRLINLFEKPYEFDRKPLEVIDEWPEPGRERKMCLWNREQVALALEKLRVFSEG